MTACTRSNRTVPQPEGLARYATVAFLVALLAVGLIADMAGRGVLASGLATGPSASPIAVVGDDAPTATAEPSPVRGPESIASEPTTVGEVVTYPNESAAAPAAEELGPTPTTPVQPVITLSAEGGCLPDGDYGGMLMLGVEATPATVTDVRVIPFVGALPAPAHLLVVLPAVVPVGETDWSWWLGPSAVDPSVRTAMALLVRVEGVPGDPTANQLARDPRGGWLLVEVPGDDPCQPLLTPTPEAEGTAPASPEPTEAPEPPTTAADEPEPPLKPTVTSEPGSGDTVVVGGLARISDAAGDDVRLRTAPAEDAPVLALLTEGTLVEVVAGRFTAIDGSRWYQIAVEDQKGFVGSDVLAPVTDGETLPEPTVEGTSNATATATAATEPNTDIVDVDLLSPDYRADPGETIRYRYRVSNPSNDVDVTVRLVVTNSRTDWISVIYEAGTTRPMTEPVTIPAGSAREVDVAVILPANARPGEQNATTLTARPVD